MTYTATLEVMLPPRGGNWSTEKVGTWDVGSVVAVYVPAKKIGPVAMPRTGYVHVSGIPDTIPADVLIRTLTQPQEDETRKQVARRLWHANVAAMVNPGKTNLLRDRFVETTWDRLKQLSVHAIERRQATDADFTLASSAR